MSGVASAQTPAEIAAVRVRADQGDAAAQYNLGLMYANGRGVPQDLAQAVSWTRKAADQGLADAQFDLGLMYAKGRGVPQDDAQAVSWYRKAADQGDANAQSNLQARTRPPLPRELFAIRDAAIEHALTATPLPSDFPRLLEWLEGDGMDAFIGDLDPADEMMVRPLDVADGDYTGRPFSDLALRDHEGLGQHVKITNVMRVQYARDAFQLALCDDSVQSRHSYRITRADGAHAVIGGTMQCEGQGGPCMSCCGVFLTREAFVNSLTEDGWWNSGALEALPDTAILFWWRR